MPTATAETSTRTNSFQDDQNDSLDEAHRFLVRSEQASEQAITETMHAFTELVKAMVPSIVLQPAKALDVNGSSQRPTGSRGRGGRSARSA